MVSRSIQIVVHQVPRAETPKSALGYFGWPPALNKKFHGLSPPGVRLLLGMAAEVADVEDSVQAPWQWSRRCQKARL
eukprot:4819079-Amphidinium_carterae.1